MCRLAKVLNVALNSPLVTIWVAFLMVWIFIVEILSEKLLVLGESPVFLLVFLVDAQRGGLCLA